MRRFELLETRDLSMGTMSDKGARALAENAPAFAHLKRLDVSRNTLTEEGQRQLAKPGSFVSVGHQREFDEDDRYAAVGEQVRSNEWLRGASLHSGAACSGRLSTPRDRR